jgi:hypothetical protein
MREKDDSGEPEEDIGPDNYIEPEENMEVGDWSASQDDMEADDWERHFDGPTDRELEEIYEREECNKEEYDEFLKWYDPEICYSQIANENYEGKVRQQKIIQWLADSRCARKFKNGYGFFVPAGPYIRFENGTSIELLDWLRKQGIRGKQTIGNYSIAYTPPESKYGEKLSFFKKVIDFPGQPKPKDDDEEPPVF